MAQNVLFFPQVKFEEIEMIPKSGKSPADSWKSVGIHEFAALARSSLNGNKLCVYRILEAGFLF